MSFFYHFLLISIISNPHSQTKLLTMHDTTIIYTTQGRSGSLEEQIPIKCKQKYFKGSQWGSAGLTITQTKWVWIG